MYAIFNKKNVIIISVILLILVLVNSFALNNDNISLKLKYETTNSNKMTIHRDDDESMASKIEKVALIVDYDIKDIKNMGYAPNDLMIKITGLGNIRDDQMEVEVDKTVAADKNILESDALFTYYYNKSTNQFIFINNKYIKDYMKGRIKLTFHIDKSKISKDLSTIITAALTAPDIKAGSSELIYEERK